MKGIEESEPSERIFACLAQVPAGKVITYGRLAQLAGLGSAARFAGTCLRKLPKDTKLAWWRVINAQGKISFPVNSHKFETQKRRLIEEGIVFSKTNNIDLRLFLWIP